MPKRFSSELLRSTVLERRKKLGMKQADLSEATGIHRGLLSRLENGSFTPSVDQIQSLADILGFEVTDLFVDTPTTAPSAAPGSEGGFRIAVAGTGYVGLSLAVLLSQHNTVTAVDILPGKVEKLNNWISPIQDEYIEQYLAEHEERGLCLKATTDAMEAYSTADIVVVAAPTNYDKLFRLFGGGERAQSDLRGDGGEGREARGRDQIHGPGRVYHPHPQEARHEQHPVQPGISSGKQGAV